MIEKNKSIRVCYSCCYTPCYSHVGRVCETRSKDSCQQGTTQARTFLATKAEIDGEQEVAFERRVERQNVKKKNHLFGTDRGRSDLVLANTRHFCERTM